MHRQRSVRDLLRLGGAYFAIAAATIRLTRFDGGVAFLWIATALLIARLATLKPADWARPLAACAAVSFVATGLFGLGWGAAAPLAVVNVGEGLIAAWLLRRFRVPEAPLESLHWLTGFVLAVGAAAPLVSGVPGALAAHFATGVPIVSSYLHWFAGHALGNLTFTPIFMLILRGEARRAMTGLSRERAAEGAALLILVSGTTAAVFLESRLPLLFLPMLPVIFATFRFGRLGASVSVILLALIGGALTARGYGPMEVIHGSTGERMQFLQFYLACTVLTVLPVTADLARRRQLMRKLRDSEARYRALADNSTDIIMNVGLDGRIRFISPSVRQLGGYEPEALVGRDAIDLIAPEHVERVQAVHLRTLKGGGRSFSVEYLARTADGEQRWFETHTRAITDADGRVDGAVSVVRDISDRKAVEGQLAEAALTDPLTGLLNRRGFMLQLEAQLARPEGKGCVALFDIDHFKRVNDTHGHAAGDRVLQAFAEVARRIVRGADVVARIGGEEFAVLLSGASLDQAGTVCDRLRRALAAATTGFEGVEIRVTVSGGVAPLGHEDADGVLRSADAALYRAKAAGRDRLALAA